jgi:hypothetical protein
MSIKDGMEFLEHFYNREEFQLGDQLVYESKMQ